MPQLNARGEGETHHGTARCGRGAQPARAVAKPTGDRTDVDFRRLGETNGHLAAGNIDVVVDGAAQIEHRAVIGLMRTDARNQSILGLGLGLGLPARPCPAHEAKRQRKTDETALPPLTRCVRPLARHPGPLRAVQKSPMTATIFCFSVAAVKGLRT
jgi:hypothetical protein